MPVRLMLRICNTHKLKTFAFRRCATLTATHDPSSSPLPCLDKLRGLISTSIGSLDELESQFSRCEVNLTPSTVMEVVNDCKNEAPARRLLRFFTWSCKNLGSALADKEFNKVIRVFAQKKDYTAVDILLSDLQKHGRALDVQTFTAVAEMMVKLGRDGEAQDIFRNLEMFKCPQDRTTVSAIVSAFCSKGYVERAENVLNHHKDKLSGVESCVYRSLLYGWMVQTNEKEARKILEQMKSNRITLDLYCFHTYLTCLCKHNLEKNQSGLVPDALDLLMEMRTYKVIPNSVTYNILLSCLCKAGRVKESLRILASMKRSGCQPDWASYYHVIRVLYLSNKFGKGNEILDMMIKEQLVPPTMFYYDLVGVLCRVGKTSFALKMFDYMKKTLDGGYGRVYDVLIPKLCENGDFETGKRLWKEAEEMGIALRCSSDAFDPSVIEAFEPRKREEDLEIEDSVEEYTLTGDPVGTTWNRNIRRRDPVVIKRSKRSRKDGNNRRRRR